MAPDRRPIPYTRPVITPSLTRRSLLAAMAALSLGGCSFSGNTPAPLAVTGDRRYPDATRPTLLISTGEVVQRLFSDPDNVRILDVRPIRDYRAGHIQGTRHVWWQDTMERNAPSYGATLKPDDEAGDQTRRRAVLDLWVTRPSHDVVVYDDHMSMEAARIVWFLSFLGFPRVAMLDGGFAAWLAEGIGQIPHPGSHGDRPAVELTPQSGYYLVYRQVLSRLAEADTVLLDVRTEAELYDTVGSTVRPGTIPGAIAWPWTDLLDANRLLRPAPELAAAARGLGLLPTQRVILVGRFATDCALTWLALQLIGFREVPTYDGGWMDWSNRSDAPVAWL